MKKFSHLSGEGEATMVDVSGKDATWREASASARIDVAGEVISRIRDELLPKGDPFEAARIAGIMAAKKTGYLVPLCHQVPLDLCDIRIEIHEDNSSISIFSSVKAKWHTGVEMEAMVAVSVASLTIYDMIKAVDRWATIGDIKLLEKKGGKSGNLKREA